MPTGSYYRLNKYLENVVENFFLLKLLHAVYTFSRWFGVFPTIFEKIGPNKNKIKIAWVFDRHFIFLSQK